MSIQISIVVIFDEAFQNIQCQNSKMHNRPKPQMLSTHKDRKSTIFLIILLTMQIDSHIHLASQTMKCLLYDCFSSRSSSSLEKEQTVLLSNGYIAKCKANRQVEIFAFNHQYSHPTHILKIQEISSFKCLKFCRNEEESMLIYALGKEVYLKYMDHEGKELSTCHKRPTLAKNQEFLFFSDAMAMKNYNLLIGYTSFCQFYLLTIKKHNKLEIFKIGNKKQSFSFLSWLKNSSPKSQCKNYYFHTYRIDENDKFVLLLSIKDNLMTLFLLELYPPQEVTTMSQIGTCQVMKKIIPSSASLREVLVITKDPLPKHLECLVSYDLKEGFMLVLFVSINFRKQNIFDVSVILEEIPSQGFSMAIYHHHLLYTHYSADENAYKIFKKKIHVNQQKRNLQQKQVDLFLTLKEQPFYFNIEDQLFINTCSEIYTVNAEQIISSEQSDLSELQLHLAEFKNEINHNYRKRVHKLLKKNPIPIDQISYLLTEKCRKIVQWIQNEFNEFNPNEEHTYLILTLEIVITITVKHLLSLMNFEEMVSIVASKQPKFTLRQLYRIISANQISSIISLMNSIAEQHPHVVNEVLNKFDEEQQLKDNCTEAIKTIFSQPFEKILFNFHENEQKSEEYCKIVRKIVDFDLGNHQTYAKIQARQPSLFKSCILSSKSIGLFVQYFLTIDFTENEVKSFAKHIYHHRRQALKRLIIEILTKCKKAYLKKLLDLHKISIILEGFLDYSHQLIPEMKKYFPGLLFFFYMRTGYQKEGLEYIKELAKNKANSSQVHSINLYDIESVEQKIREITEKEEDYCLLKNSNEYNGSFQKILSIGSAADESSEEMSAGEKKVKHD